MKFVVIDHEGQPSWNTKTEAAESFATYAAAEKRAKALASYNPGETIGIYQLAAEVKAPVGAIAVKSVRR